MGFDVSLIKTFLARDQTAPRCIPGIAFNYPARITGCYDLLKYVLFVVFYVSTVGRKPPRMNHYGITPPLTLHPAGAEVES